MTELEKLIGEMAQENVKTFEAFKESIDQIHSFIRETDASLLALARTKRLQFGNSNFSVPGIGLHFGASIVDDCVVVRPGDGSGPLIPELLNELNTGHIDAGSSIFRIDKKNETAMYVFEYWLLGGPLMGRVRVMTLCMGRCDIPATVEVGSLEGDEFDFSIIGDMGIWWSDLSGLNEDIIVSCPAREVDVDLSIP